MRDLPEKNVILLMDVAFGHPQYPVQLQPNLSIQSAQGTVDDKTAADGDDKGQGKLVGIQFDDYQLSEPFDLGKTGEYETTIDGNLFVRCRDDWCELADNAGNVTVKFKFAN